MTKVIAARHSAVTTPPSAAADRRLAPAPAAPAHGQVFHSSELPALHEEFIDEWQVFPQTPATQVRQQEHWVRARPGSFSTHGVLVAFSATRRVASLGLATVVLSLLPVGHSNAATYPTSEYAVPFGQTYTKGTLTWYNRSVQLTEEHKSVSASSCRLTYAVAYRSDGGPNTTRLSERTTKPVCGKSIAISVAVPADVVGGADFLYICLDDPRNT
ncbi:hypothetical protein [Streptomyces sp. NPDC054794]